MTNGQNGREDQAIELPAALAATPWTDGGLRNKQDGHF